MKTLFISLAALALVACSTTPKVPPEPVIQIVEVPIPTPQPCVPKTLGGEPTYPDSDEALLKAADAAVRMQLMYAGRLLRIGRLGELEPVAKSCPREK